MHDVICTLLALSPFSPQPIPWSADEFMFPVLPDDPLLMIDIEDDFEDVDGNTPDGEVRRVIALKGRIIKNPDVSHGPLTRPFTRSLAPLTHSLAPHYLLCTTRSAELRCAHLLARSLTLLNPLLMGH